MRPTRLAISLLPFSSLFIAASLISSNSALAQTTIARLVLRNYEIEISKRADGEVLYDVSSLDGQEVAVDLNEEQMQAKYPEVYDHIRPAVASEAQSPDSTLMMEMMEMIEVE